MQSYQALPSAMNAIPQDRPTTDLWKTSRSNFLIRLWRKKRNPLQHGFPQCSFGSAAHRRLRPEKPPAPHAVANGMIEELRQTESRLGVAHQAAKSYSK